MEIYQATIHRWPRLQKPLTCTSATLAIHIHTHTHTHTHIHFFFFSFLSIFLLFIPILSWYEEEEEEKEGKESIEPTPPTPMIQSPSPDGLPWRWLNRIIESYSLNICWFPILGAEKMKEMKKKRWKMWKCVHGSSWSWRDEIIRPEKMKFSDGVTHLIVRVAHSTMSQNVTAN